MKELCVVHANCQGEQLAQMLGANEAFSRLFDVELYTNYAREAVPEVSLARCRLFVYQHLSEKWGDLASNVLLARLSPACERLAIPNMVCMAYWPFWYSDENEPFHDRLLETLLSRNLGREEIVLLLTIGGVDRLWDLEGEYASWLDRERAKEARSDVKYLDFVLERFRDESLFYTPNHPREILLRHVEARVLALLGLGPNPTPSPVMPYYAAAELPINPTVARIRGLAFLGVNPTYALYGARVTYPDFIKAHVDFKLSGETDFVAFMIRRFT